MPAHTFCTICHRVVWVTDVDTEGRCCFCDGAVITVPAPVSHPADDDEDPEDAA